MKRFLSYCLIAVALIAGVTTKTMPVGESIGLKTVSNELQSSLPNHNSSFSASDLFCFVGVGNHQISLTHSFQCFSFRILHPYSNVSRISHSVQLAYQKYLGGRANFLLSSAFKQLDGYYLYHLRKLLI